MNSEEAILISNNLNYYLDKTSAMDMDLRSYLKVYHNWVDDKKCDQKVKELQASEWSQHQFFDYTTGEYKNQSGSKELMVAYDNSETTDYIMQRIWDAYRKYIDELQFPWFDSWAGYTRVRFNKYETGQLMAPHCDHITSMFEGERKGIPTLTALGCLNDNYKGGEFIMWDTSIKMRKGDMIIFPSIFLYPHRVDEVLDGERYTFVSWSW